MTRSEVNKILDEPFLEKDPKKNLVIYVKRTVEDVINDLLQHKITKKKR